MTGRGWFEGLDPDDLETAAGAVESGSAEAPADWPALAVESGFVADEDEYYGWLHAVRAMDSKAR